MMQITSYSLVMRQVTSYSLVMRQVASAALDHAAGRVEVDPQEETQVGSFQVVVDAGVVQDVEQLLDAEDRLTDRLDETVLALNMTRSSDRSTR